MMYSSASILTSHLLQPHYSEKILLSLKEIIREEDPNSRVTLLEYLKQLHPVEWLNFVKDTKTLADEHVISSIDGHSAESSSGSSSIGPAENDEKYSGKTHIDDLPFYCVGFKSSAPEYTLRTRIWASQRAQTLYRTVNGFMNYSHAIKLMYRVENPDIVQKYHGDVDALEAELEAVAHRKFKFLLAMQRYAKFNQEEQLCAELLFKQYPNLQVAYLDEQPSKTVQGQTNFYSMLIDGQSTLLPDGKRAPKYKIRLPGNPILGDGKSDNQNHALIFYRGEFLQLIDANQDNYLEECLKIRNILSEFENLGVTQASPYSLNPDKESVSPVAIVGAREYIFSENIGVLGDVAAGKEQTFGTLSQRIMAKIGGKVCEITVAKQCRKIEANLCIEASLRTSRFSKCHIYDNPWRSQQGSKGSTLERRHLCWYECILPRWSHQAFRVFPMRQRSRPWIWIYSQLCNEDWHWYGRANALSRILLSWFPAST